MINFQFLEKSEEKPLGQIKCKVDDSAKWLLDKSEFPLRFSIWENGKRTWFTDLSPNMWATWDPLQLEDCEAKIITKHGKLLKSYIPPLDATHTFLYEWASRNEGALGLVIGTHNGTHGEWVKPLRAGILNAVLVEGSRKTWEKCKQNWPNNLVKNLIVSTDGKPTKWYEFGSGEANTIDVEHMQKHIASSHLTEEKRSTTSINTLLKENKYKWLHLDLEGIDDSIIKAMDFDGYAKPELIIFETINISPTRLKDNGSRLNSLFEHLRKSGYQIKYDYWNSFAFLTK